MNTEVAEPRKALTALKRPLGVAGDIGSLPAIKTRGGLQNGSQRQLSPMRFTVEDGGGSLDGF